MALDDASTDQSSPGRATHDDVPATDPVDGPREAAPGPGPLAAFGPELRRRREARRLSLADLAGRIHYDKGYISKIEHGKRKPNAVFARACDDALDAGGQLAALAAAPTWARADDGARELEAHVARGDPGAGPWVAIASPRTPPDESPPPSGGGGGPVTPDWPELPDELRPPLVVVGGLWRGEGLAAGGLDDAVTQTFADELGRLRQMGQRMPATMVLPLVRENARLLRRMATHGGAEGVPALALAARFAEYAGWLYQETGQNTAAYSWTAGAARVAGQAGENALEGYALVRYAELALYQGSAVDVVGLADLAAGRLDASVRTRAHAAHRRAQGFALAGDPYACEMALAEAGQLLAGAGGEPAATVLGPSTAPDLDALVAGWCFYDLGRPARAVDLLAPALDAMPLTSRRLRALFGARLALACLEAGDLERACAAGEAALVSAIATDSGTALGQLAEFARRLGRWHRYPEARMMSLAVLTALQGRTAA
jgi:tetratricopeptide (TPR) repeat protein